MKKILIFVVILILPSLGAFAADEESTIPIDKIIVTTSSRTQEEIKNSSKSTTIIGTQDIQESSAQTIPDILRSEAGIEIRDYNGTGKQVNVDMRGFGETGPSNMLVLIDGRRVNAIDLSNTDWSQISLSAVERIEIVRGANSVLYGDNASSGVVNIITKKGMGRPSITFQSKGASFNTSSTSVESSGASEKSSYRLTAEYFNTDGYRKNSSLFRKDFGLQLGHTFHPLLSTNFTFGMHRDEYGLPGALKGNELSSMGRRATTKPNDSAKSQDYFANFEIGNDFKEYGKLTTNLSARVREVKATYISSSWNNANHIVTLGITPKYALERDILNLPNNLILGIDIYHDKDGITDGMIGASGDKIWINKTSVGVYGQDQIKLTEHLRLKAGLRQEYAKYNFRQIEQVQLKEKSRLSNTIYNIGVASPYGQDSSLFLDYSTSFRYPLVDEFFTSNTYGFGGLNSSLQPQTAKNIEAGIRHFLTKDFNINLTFFMHLVENEIFYNPATFVNANYDRTIHKGLEFQSDIKLNRIVKAYANYTFTSAKFGRGAYKGKKIPGVPENKYSAGLRISPTEKLKFHLVANYIDKMFLISDENNAFPRIKEWLTIDLNVNYAVGNFEIFLGLNNIFNAYYSEYGILSTFTNTQSFYPAPGRNVTAGLRYKF